MCLLVAFDETEVVDGKEFGVGYKIFTRNYSVKGLPVGRNQAYNLNEVYIAEVEKWYLEKGGVQTRWAEMIGEIKFKDVGRERYKLGFHIFLNKNDCFEYFPEPDKVEKRNKYVCRVLYNNILTIGINGTYRYDQIETGALGLCVVAKELYIKEEDWKNAEPLTK